MTMLFKKVKWASLAVAIAYVIGGLLMLLYPGKVAEFVCLIGGIALIVAGVINIITYFSLEINISLYRNDLASGAIKIMLGVMIIYFKDVFGDMVSYILAMLIIISGFSKLQDAIDAYRIGYPKSGVYVILAAISLVFGLILLFSDRNITNLMIQIAGAGMVYCGLTDLFSAFYLSGKIKKFMAGVDSLDAGDAEVISSTVEENTEDTAKE